MSASRHGVTSRNNNNSSRIDSSRVVIRAAPHRCLSCQSCHQCFPHVSVTSTHCGCTWGWSHFIARTFVSVLAMYIPVRGIHLSTPVGRLLARLSRGGGGCLSGLIFLSVSCPVEFWRLWFAVTCWSNIVCVQWCASGVPTLWRVART